MKLFFSLMTALASISPAASALSVAAVNRTAFDFNGYAAFIYTPIVSAPDKPWIWIMPAWLESARDPAIGNTGIMDFYIKAALEKGIAVAGVEIGVTFGSPKAAEFNQQFYRYVRETFQLNRKPRLLLQSNGALSGYRWAYQHPRLVSRITGIFPVLNLNSWPGEKFLRGPDNLINPAWEFLPAVFDTRYLYENSPLRLMKSILAVGVPTLFISGNADTVVPLPDNAGLARKLYGALRITLLRVPDLGHQTAKEFHQNQEVADFLTGGI